jgi:hypothetical protein
MSLRNISPMTSAERARKWRLTHIVEKKLNDAAWRENNQERNRATSRAWYQANKDRLKAKREARSAELRAIERTNKALTAHQRMKRDRVFCTRYAAPRRGPDNG